MHVFKHKNHMLGINLCESGIFCVLMISEFHMRALIAAGGEPTGIQNMTPNMLYVFEHET